MCIRDRDNDGLVRIVGFIAKDTAGVTVYESADTLAVPVQQVTRRKRFGAPVQLRGQTLTIISYAVDVAGHKGWAVPTGATVPATSEAVAKRDATVYAFGLTYS